MGGGGMVGGCCVIVTLLPTITETTKWLTLLPLFVQNHSGGGSVALEVCLPGPCYKV